MRISSTRAGSSRPACQLNCMSCRVHITATIFSFPMQRSQRVSPTTGRRLFGALSLPLDLDRVADLPKLIDWHVGRAGSSEPCNPRCPRDLFVVKDAAHRCKLYNVPHAAGERLPSAATFCDLCR